MTNNEVDPKTTASLNKQGFHRGDPEFEGEGIFEVATRPRVETAITGLRPDGEPVPRGRRYRYLDGREFADGFEENVEFYRLDYVDPDQVDLGKAFEAIHPALWLIAGGKAARPDDVDPTKPFYVAERAVYAILFDDASLREFEQALEARDDITHVFVVTDSEEAFIDARELVGHGRKTSMIYRDYLRTFRINTPQELR